MIAGHALAETTWSPFVGIRLTMRTLMIQLGSHAVLAKPILGQMSH